MRKIFFISAGLLGLYEILKVYFIMPMPGSQQWDTVELAYWLHQYRWFFRIGLGVLVLVGGVKVLPARGRLLPIIVLSLLLAIIALFNFKLSADAMFKKPATVTFTSTKAHLLPDSALLLGAMINGEAKAYPIRYLTYHHQVEDTIGGNPVLVTYCSVCRTGRIYSPVIDGNRMDFRLVGMDHFNAMFEDKETGSWWRQVSGVAITGPMKGRKLPDLESYQLTKHNWKELFPNGVVMNLDPAFYSEYDTLGKFEFGLSESDLTKTEKTSWQEKSWVLGIPLDGSNLVYDWIKLKETPYRIDSINNKYILIFITPETNDYAGFALNQKPASVKINSNTFMIDSTTYSLAGIPVSGGNPIKRLPVHQEFWHSWHQFHPDSRKMN